MTAMMIDGLAIVLELIIYFFLFRHFFGRAKFLPFMPGLAYFRFACRGLPCRT